MLLPDGRVVSAGDDYSGRFTGAEAERNFTQDSAEIYEPPYLFDGNAKAPPAEADRARPTRLSLDKTRTVLRVRTARERSARDPGRAGRAPRRRPTPST